MLYKGLYFLKLIKLDFEETFGEFEFPALNILSLSDIILLFLYKLNNPLLPFLIKFIFKLFFFSDEFFLLSFFLLFKLSSSFFFFFFFFVV